MRYLLWFILILSSLMAQSYALEDFEVQEIVYDTVTLKKNDTISFYNTKSNSFDYGTVTNLYKNGVVVFSVREFHNNGSYFTFEKYRAHLSQIGIPTKNHPSGYKKGQYCLSGKPTDIETIFTNDTAKAVFGDFFGKRFLFFEYWKIVPLTQLKNCN